MISEDRIIEMSNEIIVADIDNSSLTGVIPESKIDRSAWPIVAMEYIKISYQLFLKN